MISIITILLQYMAEGLKKVMCTIFAYNPLSTFYLSDLLIGK